MTTDEDFEKWLLEYYIQHGHYFSKDELHECWLAATKATAQRCVEICDVNTWADHIAIAIKQEFDL